MNAMPIRIWTPCVSPTLARLVQQLVSSLTLPAMEELPLWHGMSATLWHMSSALGSLLNQLASLYYCS
jgi:hypothetical protein